MSLIGSILIVVLFMVLLQVLRLVDRAREAIEVSRISMEIMRDASLGDEEKEVGIQRNALRLFRLLFILAFGFALALMAPVGIIWLLDLSGLLSLSAVLALMVRWDFILVTSVICVIYIVVVAKREP
jgi:hypothetical protein